VEDEESLKSGTVVGQVSHSIQDGIDELLSDGVVSSGVCDSATERKSAKVVERRRKEGEERTVVGGILLSRDQSLRVEKRLVGSSSDLVNDVGLEIDLRKKEKSRSVSEKKEGATRRRAEKQNGAEEGRAKDGREGEDSRRGT